MAKKNKNHHTHTLFAQAGGNEAQRLYHEGSVRLELNRLLDHFSEYRRGYLDKCDRSEDVLETWVRCLAGVREDDLHTVVEHCLAGDLPLPEHRGHLAICLRGFCKERSDARDRSRVRNRSPESGRRVLIRSWKLSRPGEARDWSGDKCLRVLERLEGLGIVPGDLDRDNAMHRKAAELGAVDQEWKPLTIQA